MRRICLTLPTNRPCVPALRATYQEAAHAAARFGAEVHLLVLDSAAPAGRQRHAEALRALPQAPGVVVHHLDEDGQRDFLRRVIERAGPAKPERMLDLMLPAGVSYGACTNRAFLMAAALGCASVHRRDSDSGYQERDGEPVFPIVPELTALGRTAAEAAADVTAVEPGTGHTAFDALAGRTVSMVGASFVGEMSVDIAEMERLDPEVYHEVVGLWAPAHWPAERKRELAAESFRGAGGEPFTADRWVLGPVDPMRVDMCNIAFHGVHEQVPLMPATDTIGSDYFLIHLVYDAGLPGVLHNRNIVNFHTGERKTDEGFTAYQLRFAKFLLSMLYLNHVYDAMAEAGAGLLDAAGRIEVPAVTALLRESAALDQAENRWRLDVLDRAYRRLGGRYAEVAELLAQRRERLLDEARRDIEDYALLAESWPALIASAAGTALVRPRPDAG